MADTVTLMRKRVLDMAIRGELVEQRESEGTGQRLYQNIQLEKERLMKDGEINKEKVLSDIKGLDTPFEIPNNWQWIHFGNIISLISGRDLQTKDFNEIEKGLPYITGASNFNNGDLIVNRWTENPKVISMKGDLLITVKGTIGEMHFQTLEEAHIARQIMAIRNEFNVNANYLKYFLDAQLLELKDKAKSMIPGISREDILLFELPLPPLEEQKRIVAKIDEIFAVIDQIGTRKEEALAIINNMRQTALQDAIMGVLVEQDETDETASALYEKIQAEKKHLIKAGEIKKEKRLPGIESEKAPFEIPDNWMWVRLGDLTKKMGSGSTPRGGQSNYIDAGIPFIRSQNVYNNGLRLDTVAYISEAINESKKNSKVYANDILLNITGASIGRCALVREDFEEGNVNQHVLIVRLIDNQIKRYVHYVMTSPYIFGEIMELQSGGTKEGLSASNAKLMKIPLPPLPEQERIVEKLEEIMAICDEMEVILNGSSEINKVLKEVK